MRVPTKAPFAEGGVIPASVREALLQNHGNFVLAYSVAFQPRMYRFGDERGFIAYRKVGKTAFALADPLAPQERWPSLLDEFVAQKKDVTFWQVSRPMAQLLTSRGFFVNALGIENFIDLADFSFDGPKRRSFRTAVNRFTRTGHSVAEIPLATLDPEQVEAVSVGWRKTRTTKRRELSFLVRPIQLTDEKGVRKFFILDSAGKPVALAFFDPLYENGKLIGYLSATRRWLPDVDPLAAYFLVRHAVETFQSEGVPRVYFGLMPFHRIEDKEFNKDWLTRRAFRFIYTNPLAQRFIYPTQSLAKHKESYGGETRETWCAMNTTPSLPRLLKLVRACGIV
ncbi:DUF2156 domain-containing protein [Nitratireductor sp. ZSWI3]|uniref:DUF2156 domain-containing protein n=1 Tax=Nitratireductor sp. ZSWI3 TaxID=2966359 RepID=UPI00214FCB48|nr:DUF2156 domain-containing protein [Nitratireductor sp. ZSWI3]MCR4264949.1 DUF2156 domain-containing protein [Nitratireductor sp. ZSWI3]